MAVLVGCEAVERTPDPDPVEADQGDLDAAMGQAPSPDAAERLDAGRPDARADAGRADQAPWPGPCVYELEDAEGRPSGRVVFTYDQDRRLAEESIDFEADGVIDLSLRIAYTEEGWVRERVTDYLHPDADYLDELKRFTYDRRGRVLTEVTDSNHDGDVDHRSTHVYDDSAMTETWRQEGESGVSIHIFQLDAHGHPLRLDLRDRDGDYLVVYVLTHDEGGRLLVSDSDSGGDGTIDFRSTFTYHSNGAYEVIEHDFDVDGAPEFRTVRDPRGTIVEEYVNYGERHFRWRASLDDAGNRTRCENDHGDDGTVDEFGHYIYDCWLSDPG